MRKSIFTHINIIYYVHTYINVQQNAQNLLHVSLDCLACVYICNVHARTYAYLTHTFTCPTYTYACLTCSFLGCLAELEEVCSSSSSSSSSSLGGSPVCLYLHACVCMVCRYVHMHMRVCVHVFAEGIETQAK